jgi:hypothetical protein
MFRRRYGLGLLRGGIVYEDVLFRKRYCLGEDIVLEEVLLFLIGKGIV